MPAPDTFEVPFGACTDIGRARSNNEDRYKADSRLGLFLVVDGVGGQTAGEVASECVATSLHQFIDETSGGETRMWPFALDPALSFSANRLRVAILVANRALADRIDDDESLDGMAATMAALLLAQGKAIIANVGDCRGYLFRDRTLTQVTLDHSLVAEQVRMGLLDPEAARTHPLRNVVTRALSGEDRLAIDVVEFDVRSGDTFVLCSDGLSSMVADDEIGRCLTETLPDTSQACRRLIQLANQEGGKDNITVLVVHIPRT